MEDVTERRQAGEEVARAKESAGTANKTKNLFLAMSHELRTPLNVILGYSEMLQEEAMERKLGGEFVADLEKINGAGKHLLALINDILDWSKIEAGTMELFLENFNLSEMIEEVASTIQPMVKKNANTLHIQREPDLGAMYADQIKVRQGLFNLLSNAVKFTHEGNITLEAGRQSNDGSEWIVFCVTDTGVGLTPDGIDKLFKDFTQSEGSATRKFGGAGLGLALTRRFCEMMGGEVTVRSRPGEGSVFTIKLPAVVSETKAETALKKTGAEVLIAPLPEGGVENSTSVSPTVSSVLVIHDDRMQRDLIRRFLIKEGFWVRAAENGEKGLRLARQFPPVAIILDVMMADMEGWRVLLALKSDPDLRDIPVIMMTMVSELECGFTLGAADIATKPVDRARLSQILKKYACPHPPCSVLLVEDNPATREVTRAMLEKEGWKVSEAENGNVALECMERERPSLILLDLMMPEMDGFEFAIRVRRNLEWRLIPIVVLTARDLSGEERRRLNGCVETVLHQSGDSCETMLRQLCDLLDAHTASRAMTIPARNAKRATFP